MDVDVQYGCSGVAWERVSEILERVGMAHYLPDAHRRAFEASHTALFVYQGDQLIGFGRALSDGVYQAALYDVAVLPECQGKGIGKRIVKSLLGRLSACNVILYAAPGKEEFYQTLGFRKMKTGMALFKSAGRMTEKGFTE
jgi:ribosomal protein S18 acetylase RimI-like enzyme